MDQVNLQDIKNDWFKVGTMLVVSRVLSGGSLQDQAWQRSSLNTLLGFTAYHVLTKNLVDTARFGEFKPIADTWLKVGTMLVVSRLLSGGNLADRTWQMSSLFTLLGFTAYHLLTSKLVKGDQLADNAAVVSSINDWANVGTMLVVSHLLGGGNLQNQTWQRSSLYTLLGFTAYNFLSNL